MAFMRESEPINYLALFAVVLVAVPAGNPRVENEAAARLARRR